jgi:hypothetical protein
MAALKAELRDLLSEPLVAKGISTRYITSGSAPIVDDLLAGECESSRYLGEPRLTRIKRSRGDVGSEKGRSWRRGGCCEEEEKQKAKGTSEIKAG